jgi:hypothetical protein
MLDFMGFLLFRCPLGSFQFFGSDTKSMELVSVPLPHIGGGFASSASNLGPYILFILLMFGLEQAEGFLGTQLGNSCEILDPRPIENLSTSEFACAET